MIFIKRFFLRIAGLFALLLLLCGSALAADAQISEMKTDCQILSDGSCQMTQTITVDVTGLASELRFPLPEGAKKASVAGYQAKKTMDGDNPVLVLEDAVGFSGSRTFIVTYTTGRLAAGQEDGSQLLRLPLQCPKWEYPVADYSFTVTLPTPVSVPAPSFSSGYYGDVIADMIELRSSEGVISGRIPAGLKDHEALEMTMRFESGYFSGAYAAASAGWVRTAAVALLCVCAFAYWALTLRSPGLHAVSRALPPDSALPCDLPFLLCGAKPDFNMLVLQWANLGYVSIGVSQKGNVSLYKWTWETSAEASKQSSLRFCSHRATGLTARAFFTSRPRSARRRRLRITGSVGFIPEAAEMCALRSCSARWPAACSSETWR